MKQKQIIMTGDLSNLSIPVAKNIEENYDHHRTPWFEDILEYLIKYFKGQLGREFQPLVLTCTHEGAIEAIKTNLHKEYFLINHVKNNGKLTNLVKICKKLKSTHPNSPIIIDVSQSFGGDKIHKEAISLADGFIIIPERALMGIPGLSVIALKNPLLKKIKKDRIRLLENPYTLDLIKANDAWLKKRTTPYSPNISSCVALKKSLQILEKQGGIEQHLKRHILWAKLVRNTFQSMGVMPAYTQRNYTKTLTVFKLPKDIDAQQFTSLLEKQKNIIVKIFSKKENSIKIGHTGYLDEKILNYFFEAFSKALEEFGYKNNNPEAVCIPPSLKIEEIAESKKRIDNLLKIPYKEFLELSKNKASSMSRKEQYIHKIHDSALKIFRPLQEREIDQIRNRTIGFIGAGNVVRHSVEKCKALGINNLMVYSPSLARLKNEKQKKRNTNDHKTIEYWEARNVKIARSNREIFLSAHTVVLLPTFYNKKGLKIFGKTQAYFNENLINEGLLKEIKQNGKMDFLINSSARGGLIEKKALSKELKEGWLIYCSDELPLPNDPLLKYKNALFTGHVGGSGKSPQKQVALNTNKILRQVIRQILHGGKLSLSADSKYTINLINPRTIWGRGSGQNKNGSLKEIRILLSDSFDKESLGFRDLGRLGAQIAVLDISNEIPTSESIKQSIKNFRPHILMVRTRTKITKDIMGAARDVEEFCAIIRPGVGVDNIYDGIEKATKLGIQIINEPYGNSFAVSEMTLYFLTSKAQKTMLTPGPTRFNPEIFTVKENYTHPSSTRFKKNYNELVKKLKKWLGSSNNILIFSGPSTGLMETAVSCLTSKGDRGLVVSHGKFGNRFKEIALAKKRDVLFLEVEEKNWGKSFSPNQIENVLKKAKKSKTKNVSFLCFQQNESSSGVSYSASQIKKIVRIARSCNPDMAIIVDAVSGAFSAPLEFDELGIDAMIVGSQKALGVASVISYVALSERAVDKISNKKRYMSISRLLKNKCGESSEEIPNIFHILSTLKSLNTLEAEGGKREAIRRHKLLASFCRKEIKKMGLKLMSNAPHFSNSVTPIILPQGISAPELRKKMEELYGISIAGAQSDYWKVRMVRIGHLGYVYKNDLARCLRAFRIVIKELNEGN